MALTKRKILALAIELIGKSEAQARELLSQLSSPMEEFPCFDKNIPLSEYIRFETIIKETLLICEVLIRKEDNPFCEKYEDDNELKCRSVFLRLFDKDTMRGYKNLMPDIKKVRDLFASGGYLWVNYYGNIRVACGKYTQYIMEDFEDEYQDRPYFIMITPAFNKIHKD